jgi:drug/metabolite transporter (DMT)-like permease
MAGIIPSVTVSSPSSRLVLGVAVGLLAMLLYAGQFVISRWSLQRTLTLWDVAVLRFAVAGVLMLPLLLRYGVRDAAGIGWWRANVLGVTVGMPYTLVLFAGLTFAPASHGAVILAGGTPVAIALLVWLWFGERPSPVNATGLCVIVVGLVLVSWPSLTDGVDRRVWIGDLVFVGGAGLWGTYTLLARRWQVDPLRGAAVVWVLALAYVPVYLAVAGDRLLAAPAYEVAIQGLYQGVGVALLALLLYTRSIRELGPSNAALLMPLIPIFAVFLAIPILGEVPVAVQWIGIAAVSAGMVLASRRSPS